MSASPLSWAPLAVSGLLLAAGGDLAGTPVATAAEAQAAPGALGVQQFVLDAARSELGFHGTSTLHDFTGRSTTLDGVLFTDPSRAGAFAVGEVVCAAASLDTEDEGRDEKMREHLHAERFPLLAFALESVEPVPGAAADGPWPERLRAEGTFRIHGVERRRSLELLIEP
ncbi:MAG: YceI family protein, partial [Planctomycetota bacterium]|nr:YceI family protein [Planctomycetota bacterium]